jgi:hypothetical protein
MIKEEYKLKEFPYFVSYASEIYIQKQKIKKGHEHITPDTLSQSLTWLLCFQFYNKVYLGESLEIVALNPVTS